MDIIDIGPLSLLPPLIAIGLALWTRQVFISLFIGLWLGFIILAGGNPITGLWDLIDGLVAVFEDAGNTRIILFTLIMGALIALIQRAVGRGLLMS
jgi:Na+/H+ antiporter NhaC